MSTASSSGQSNVAPSGSLDTDIVLGHALNSLEPERVEHFWEKGFWSNVFTDSDPVDSMFPKGLKRLLSYFEPAADGSVEEDPDETFRETFREQSQVLVDVFYNKALSTLLKRCSGVNRITCDLKKRGCRS